MLATTRHRFLDDYIKIRHAEGRGSQDAAYYLALPYRDITGRLLAAGFGAARIEPRYTKAFLGAGRGVVIAHA